MHLPYRPLAALALAAALLTACNPDNRADNATRGTDNSGLSADSTGGGMLRSDTTSSTGGRTPGGSNTGTTTGQ